MNAILSILLVLFSSPSLATDFHSPFYSKVAEINYYCSRYAGPRAQIRAKIVGENLSDRDIKLSGSLPLKKCQEMIKKYSAKDASDIVGSHYFCSTYAGDATANLYVKVVTRHLTTTTKALSGEMPIEECWDKAESRMKKNLPLWQENDFVELNTTKEFSFEQTRMTFEPTGEMTWVSAFTGSNVPQGELNSYSDYLRSVVVDSKWGMVDFFDTSGSVNRPSGLAYLDLAEIQEISKVLVGYISKRDSADIWTHMTRARYTINLQLWDVATRSMDEADSIDFEQVGENDVKIAIRELTYRLLAKTQLR